MADIPEDKKGVGMGFFYTSLFLGGSLGIAITAFLINLLSPYYLLHHINGFELSTQELSLLQLAATGARPLTDLNTVINSTQIQQAISLAKESFSFAFTIVQLCNVLLCMICLYCYKWLNKPQKALATSY